MSESATVGDSPYGGSAVVSTRSLGAPSVTAEDHFDAVAGLDVETYRSEDRQTLTHRTRAAILRRLPYPVPPSASNSTLS